MDLVDDSCFNRQNEQNQPSCSSNMSEEYHLNIFNDKMSSDSFLPCKVPLTSQQFNSIYQNLELKNLDNLIKNYIQNSSLENHQFYLLIQNYYKARHSLTSIGAHLTHMKDQIKSNYNLVWSSKDIQMPVQGYCQDGNKVNSVHLYTQAILQNNSLEALKTSLKELRSQVCEQLSMETYTSELSKLHIQVYLYELSHKIPSLNCIASNAPITAYSDSNISSKEPFVDSLTQCIQILFEFQRKPITDEVFSKDCKTWLTELVAILLRFASINDHLYLLNEVLFCPVGSSKWSSSFIQMFAPFHSNYGDKASSEYHLNHIITVISLILSPVRRPDHNLPQPESAAQKKRASTDNQWSFVEVDSDGEENEDSSNTNIFLNEADILTLLEQVPLKQLFSYIFYIEYKDDLLSFNIENITEFDVFKIFAICFNLIEICEKGFHTYSTGSYKQLNKWLLMFIGEFVQHMSEFWKHYILHIDASPTKTQLQLEFDHFFFRSLKTMLLTQKQGMWQFISNMFFENVSESMMWTLTLILFKESPLDVGFSNTDLEVSQLINDSLNDEKFTTRLLSMQTAEIVHLITSFSNMALSQDSSNSVFIKMIVQIIFNISFINKHSRNVCFKEGRQLLSTVAYKFDFILPFILLKCIENIQTIGKVSLFLFRELPICLWDIDRQNFDLLGSYLTNNDILSIENQLSQLIFENLNWSFDSQINKSFLSLDFHRDIGILILKSVKKNIGGKHVNGTFVDGIKRYQKLAQDQSSFTIEQNFLTWAWKLLFNLKVHLSDRPNTLDSHTSPDPSLNPHYDVLLQCAQDPNGVASYLLLSMTQYGNSTTVFSTHGLQIFSNLVKFNLFIPAVHSLAKISALYFDSIDSFLQHKSLLSDIQLILLADRNRKGYLSHEFPGTVTMAFASMILIQIAEEDLTIIKKVISFWIQVLTHSSKWYLDSYVKYIIDKLIQRVFFYDDAFSFIISHFSSLYKKHLNSQKESSFLTGITSWLTSSHELPSFIEQSFSDLPWFAFIILLIETKYENDCGLWSTLYTRLLDDPEKNIDQTFKNVLAELKMNVSLSFNKIQIYRWALQALNTPIEHPVLPLIWQQFFIFYLGRFSPESKEYHLGSVGEKFFNSTYYVSMIKSMGKRLQETSQYYQKLSASDQPETQGSSESEEFNLYKHLSNLFETMSFWLNEPRLHSGDLYLPSLPPQYNPGSLSKIFYSHNDIWKNFVNNQNSNKQIEELKSFWYDICFNKRITFSSLSQAKLVFKRKMSRLYNYTNYRKPPEIVVFKPILPEFNESILLNKVSLLAATRSDFTNLVNFTCTFSNQLSKHAALDSSYLELLSQLYQKELNEATVTAPCRSSFNPAHKCSGPAVIKCQYEFMSKNTHVQQKLDENRVKYNQLLIEFHLPPNTSIVSSAVNLEKIITFLVKLHNSHTAPTCDKSACIEVATALFYHMCTLVSNETKLYPPTCQFFSFCLEVLGQEFIRNNPLQTQPLLHTILQNPSLTGLLSPNFYPNANPDLFVSMHETIASVPDKQGPDVAFTLLTKFDLTCWFDTRPSLVVRSHLIKSIYKGLTNCGTEPDNKLIILMQIYQTHLKTLLYHQFPDHYGEILTLIFLGCSTQKLCVDVLVNFLSYFEFVDNCTINKEYALTLTKPQIEETLNWISEHFTQLRSSTSGNSTFGIYPILKPYLKFIPNFLERLFKRLADHILSDCCASSCKPNIAITQLMECLLTMLSAWLWPIENQSFSLPWVDEDSSFAIMFINSFINCFLHLYQLANGIDPTNGEELLNLLFTFYALKLAKPSLPEYMFLHFHDSFIFLPWHSFKPNVQSFRLMMNIHQSSSQSCFLFCTHIFTQIKLPDLMRYYREQEATEDNSEYFYYVLSLMVRMSVDENIVQNTKICDMIENAPTYDWTRLKERELTCVFDWLVNNCDPVKIANHPDGMLSYPPLFLLKYVSLFWNYQDIAKFTCDNFQNVNSKRISYVSSVVQILNRCWLFKEISVSVYCLVIKNLLEVLDTISSADENPTQDFLEQSCNELFKLFNRCLSQELASTTLLLSLTEWLSDHPGSLLVLCIIRSSVRSITSPTVMVQLIESCIQLRFSNTNNVFDKNKEWATILSEIVVNDARLTYIINSALNTGSYLFLYSFFVKQLPLCQSLSDESIKLNQLITWTSSIKQRCLPNDEDKLFLWWDKILELVNRQIEYGTDQRHLARTLHNFVPIVIELGEDKDSSGLLGAIGFGKKSPLTPRFRFICKVVGAFMSAQMPLDGSLRCIPNSPGAMGSSNMKAMCRPSSSTFSCIKVLESLKTNKTFTPFLKELDFGLSYVYDSSKTIKDSHTLLKHFVRCLYYDREYLSIVYTV